MNSEIIRLGLPRGRWQDLIKKLIHVAEQVECSYPNEDSVVFSVRDRDGEVISQFQLSFMPGCKGILVSHAMAVSPGYRKQGIARKLQTVKARVAKDLRVSVLFATVRDDNVAEKKVLKTAWKQVEKFNNSRTGNNVLVFVRKVV